MDLNEKIREMRDDFYERLTGPLKAAAGACESPIELAMLWALISQACGWGTSGFTGAIQMELHPFWPGVTSDAPPAHLVSLGDDVTIAVQPTITTADGKEYRLDLALHRGWTAPDGKQYGNVYLAVECDGHEWHERTKDQAQRDKTRERAIQGLGYHVARFTGSEIVRAPKDAAMQAWRVLSQLHRLEMQKVGGPFSVDNIAEFVNRWHDFEDASKPDKAGK